MSTTTNASADWVGSTRMKLLAWWLPNAALVAGLLLVVPARMVIWIAALAWMGVACILNAHCRFTGPYYLVMIIPVLELGLRVVPAGLFGWLVLSAFIILGSKMIWWATERAWGKFSYTVEISIGRPVPSVTL
jgi:hypothetical protein